MHMMSFEKDVRSRRRVRSTVFGNPGKGPMAKRSRRTKAAVRMLLALVSSELVLLMVPELYGCHMSSVRRLE